MPIFSEINDIAEMLMKERKFNPLEFRKLYFLYSKKVDNELNLSVDDSYNIYFTCNNNHNLDFRIHQLEFDDVGEWMHWHAKGLKEEKARIRGIRTFTGTFYGNIKTDERCLDVVARNLRIVEVRGEKKRIEDSLPIYGLMAYTIKSIYPVEKMPSK